jgi:phage protein D
MSDESVFKKIANEHGLTPQITLSGPTHRVLAQVNQSDLAFIRARARVLGAELWMDAKKLCAVPRSQRNGQTLTMGYKSGLREFSVLADLSQQRTGIAVNGWDVAGKTNLHYEATDSSVNAELAGDASGASILSARFGQRKEAFAHTVPLTAPETQTEAEALFRMYARRFVTGWGIAETDVRLRVGSYAELRQLGPLFSGKYYITEVKHMFDGVNGLRTEFRAERPGLGRPQQ